MAVYWSKRWERHAGYLQPLLTAGMALGVVMVALLHDPHLVNKLFHRTLPSNLDPLRRVQGWKETARIIGRERRQLAQDGTPEFIIAEHYGFTSQISFYLPEARSQVNAEPLVYFCATPRPQNQFFYWPNYLQRTGQNALFVREVSRPLLRPDWFARWWSNQRLDLYQPTLPQSKPLPPEILQQFDSFTDLGVRDVVIEGNLVRRFQLIQCHHLKSPSPLRTTTSP